MSLFHVQMLEEMLYFQKSFNLVRCVKKLPDLQKSDYIQCHQTTRDFHSNQSKNYHHFDHWALFLWFQFPLVHMFLKGRNKKKKIRINTIPTILIYSIRTMHPCPCIGRDIILPQVIEVSCVSISI